MKPYFDNGQVTIYHGNAADVVPTLPKVHLTLTDPPYAFGGAKKEWKTTAAVALGLNAAARQILEGGAMLVFAAASGRSQEFTIRSVSPLPLNRTLVWHKAFVNSRVAGPWRWDIVPILAFGRASFGRPESSSLFSSKGPASKKLRGETGHPAELPPEIADWLYRPFDREEVVVLDPFLGTGQLLLPAVKAGRKVIGVEVDERWCEVAAKLVEKLA